MRVYAYLAIILAVVGGLTWSHLLAYNSGKQGVLAKLQSDRVEVLKDGKAVDEKVLSADDATLTCLLLDNCPDKPL